MSRFERWLIHASHLAVGGTGLIYAVMLYALESDDPFSVVNHPLQPHVQHLHVLAAPLFIFAVGVIWQRHIWANWRRGVRRVRRSGIGLLLLLAPMVASGYLLQTAVAPLWRQIWMVVHLAASGVWVVAFLIHFALRDAPPRGRRLPDRRAPSAPPP